MLHWKHIIQSLVLSCCVLMSSSLAAEIWGKADFAPAFVHVDVLESNKTVKRMNMIAFKGDATIIVWKGVCLKPTLLLGTGGGGIASGGLGIGHCTPINDWLCVTPSAGCLLTHLHTKIKVHHPLAGEIHFKEKFRSISPYISLEVTVKFAEKWRVCAQYQYSWSSTRTKLSDGPISIPEFKSHSDGASYAAMIEYDVTKCWSIQLGGAYNISLSKEKHGLRGYGGKLGVAYWF